MLPQWTELESGDIDAIQHLRLNVLRDSINSVFFPYITLITPYLRVTSWLVWTNTQLDRERKESANTFSIRNYEERTELYYKILATADALHSAVSNIEHHGPVGIDRINTALSELEGNEIDFSNFLSNSRISPVYAYSNSIINMKLWQPTLFSTRRNEFIHTPTEKGKELAKEFERNLVQAVSRETFVKKTVWSRDELENLGKKICLQGLLQNDQESKLILQAAKRSLKEPAMFDGLVDIVLQTGKKSMSFNLPFQPQDIGRAALYRSFRNNGRFIQQEVSESPSTTILSYHELHTHMSFGADAILAGLSFAAKNCNEGIFHEKVVEGCREILTKDDTWKPETKLTEIIEALNKNTRNISNSNQTRAPAPDGPYGFETMQEKISNSRQNAFGLVTWGSMALLQAACCEEWFNKKWLSDLILDHGTAFSAYTFLQELQSMDKNSSIIDWISHASNRVIEQHEDVARSKGPYATKILRNNNLIICVDEPTDYGKNRGRLATAIAWISEAGFLTRNENEYKIREP